VSFLQFEPTGGNNPSFRRLFAPRWNDGFNPARSQLGEDTREVVGRVQRGDRNSVTRHLTVMNTACGHLDVENDAWFCVDRSCCL